MEPVVTSLVAVVAPSPWTALIAVILVFCVGCMWLRQSNLRQRLRRLETELQQQRNAAEQNEAARTASENQAHERTRSLENRNTALLHSRRMLELANQRLQRLVAIDSLTGVANRRQFDRSLERELRRARRDAQPLSLIFLDLDEFKRFNDTYGHGRGDDVLRKVAQTLNETFRRGGDFVARYGGEEFAVVLPGVDARRAALYAERLRRRIWRLSIPYEAAQPAGRITISGGVATVPPSMVATPDELLNAADQALYRAKCLGRNQIASAAVMIAASTAQKSA